MAKIVRMENLINVILSTKQLDDLSTIATIFRGKEVIVLADSSDKCYSYNDWATGFNIRLGRDFYPEAFQDRKPIPYLDLKNRYKEIASIIFGAFYHETFHTLYTNFPYSSDKLNELTSYFRSFAAQVSNILEDITIEETGCHFHPEATKYIRATRKLFTQPHMLESMKEALTNNVDDPGTMLGYLLHYVRGTDMTQFPTYKYFEDNKEFIKNGINICINTIDSSLRIRRQIAFALQLVKILNMEKPSEEEVTNPKNTSTEDNEGNSKMKGRPGGPGTESLKPLQNLSSTEHDNRCGSNPKDSYDKIENPGEVIENNSEISDEMEEATSTTKAQRDSSSQPVEMPALNADLTKAKVSMLANDDPISNYSHHTYALKDYVNTSKYMAEYIKVVKENEPLIRQCVATIRKMISQNNTGWEHYKMTGKFDVDTAYKKDNYKFFKKKVAPCEVADLGISILIDNSGSMTGAKALLAGKALIIFCEALHRLHIPFCVNAFTEMGPAITIKLKDYNESYEKVKTNMTLFTDQFNVNAIGTWCGNIDEVNLQHVAHELEQQRQKDKVLIVISDGATCGSAEDLSKVASNIEARGITVLGIGIYDNNVSQIYKHSTILKNKEDLEKLGSFLNKYLVRKIFK